MRRSTILVVTLVLVVVGLSDTASAWGRRQRAGRWAGAAPGSVERSWSGSWNGPWSGPWGGLWASAWAGQYAVKEGDRDAVAPSPVAGYPYPGYAYTVGLRGAHGKDLTGWSGWYGAWGPRWLPDEAVHHHGAW